MMNQQEIDNIKYPLMNKCNCCERAYGATRLVPLNIGLKLYICNDCVTRIVQIFHERGIQCVRLAAEE